MPRIALLLLLSLVVGVVARADECKGDEGKEDESREDEWISLLHRDSLDGWTPKIKGYPVGENFGDTFRVENGTLKVRYDGYEGPFNGRFGHLFYNEPYSNYELRIEYRIVGEQYPLRSPSWALRNSGVMFHGQRPETMKIDQDFPVSIEVQLLGGDGENERPTANLCTPGTNVVLNGKLHTDHCTKSTSNTFHGDDWVTCEVEVRGEQVIRHKINGEVVLEYHEPQLDPNDDYAAKLLASGASKGLTGGTISFQSESHPVDFRNIKIRKLEP